MRSSLLTASLALLWAAHLPAQLSGTYTINPKGEGPRNFESLDAAVKKLNNRGIGAAVTFLLEPGDYSGSWELYSVDQSSESDTITFRSRKPGLARLSSETEAFVFIQEAANYVLDGLAFVGSGAGHGAIRGEAATQNIEIRNCFFGPELSGNKDGGGVLFVEGGGSSSEWNIHHNRFDLQRASGGMYLSRVGKFDIHDNEFVMDGVNNCLYFINKNDAYNKIHHNLFTGSCKTAVHVAASNLGNDIYQNQIVIESPGGYAIETFGTQGNHNKFYGNLVVVGEGGGGIHLSHSTLLHFKSDGNLFCNSSGMVGTIKTPDGTEACDSLEEWHKASEEKLPLGKLDTQSYWASPKFLEQHKDLFQLMKTGKVADPATLEKARSLLDSQDPGVVRVGIHALARAGREGWKAVAKLTMLCSHQDPYVRCDALEALGTISMTAEIAIPEIRRLLDDDNPLVVQSAVRALGSFGPFSIQAVPRLRQLLEVHEEDDENSKYPRRTIERAIEQIRGEAPKGK